MVYDNFKHLPPKAQQSYLEQNHLREPDEAEENLSGSTSISRWSLHNQVANEDQAARAERRAGLAAPRLEYGSHASCRQVRLRPWRGCDLHRGGL